MVLFSLPYPSNIGIAHADDTSSAIYFEHTVAWMLALLPPVVTIQHHCATEQTNDAYFALRQPLPMFAVARTVDEEEVIQTTLCLTSRKATVVQSYISDAEKIVDRFLETEYHFVHDVIPWDYLEVPPRDLQQVSTNLNTLLHVTAEIFLPSSRVSTACIAPFVQDVWRRHLDPLRHCMARQLLTLRDAVVDSRAERGRLVKLHDSLQRDLDHLDTMRELDKDFVDVAVGTPDRCSNSYLGNHVTETSKGLCETVPVSGTLIGRLHRLENEHRTVLEHWSARSRSNR